ncbi:MAG: tetratricopeptide repeat protein [Candidatus Binatia bacterium]|jgi:tetratricopeptide (TPR) repeat protein
MGTEGQRRGATPLSAVLLMVVLLCGCNAARVQSNEARVEARPADASPGVQDLVVEGLRQDQAGSAEGAIENYKAALAAEHDPAKKANLLLVVAIDYLRLGRWEEAAQAAEQATAIRLDYAEAYWSLGEAYANLGRFQEAADAFQQAINIKPDDAAAYYGLGELYSFQGRFEDAIGPFERAIQLDPSVPQTHYFLALAYGKVGRLQDAIPAYESAIRIKPDYIDAQFQLGLAYLAIGRAQPAVEPLRQTVRLKPDSAEAQATLGFAFTQVGSWQEAVDACQRAIKIKPDYAEAYVNLSTAYTKLGRFNESFEASAEALRLKPELASAFAPDFRATDAPEEPADAVVFYNRQRQAANQRGDVNAEAAAALGLADAYDALGQLVHARVHLTDAVGLYGAAGDLQGQARALMEIGLIDEDTGRYDEALASYHRAAVLYRGTEDRQGLAEALTRIGHQYELAGAVYDAIQWYQLAFETAKAGGDAANEVRALAGLMPSAFSAGDQQLAERYRPEVEPAFRALSAAMSQGKPRLPCTEALRSWSQGEATWGAPQNAIAELKFLVALYRAAAPKTRRFVRETAADLYFLGVAYARMQKYEEALDVFSRAADTARQWHASQRYRVTNAMGSVREKQGKLDDALELYKKAVEGLEAATSPQHVVEVRFSLQQLTSSLYDDVTRVLLKLHSAEPHYVEQSFLYNERGRARMTQEVLKAGQADGAEDGASMQERKELSAAVTRMQRVVQREKVPGDRDARLQAALADQENALRARETTRVSSDTRVGRRVGPTIQSVADVQAILEPETALLEYSLGEQRSALWVVMKDTLHVYELPDEHRVTEAVEKYLRTLRTPLLSKDEAEEHRKQGRDLYDLLLKPAAAELQTLTGFVVVPSGSLSYLPFETLIMSAPEGLAGGVNDGLLAWLGYVGKTYAVSYAPSASVLVALGRSSRTGQHGRTPHQLPLLAFGDPVYERPSEPGSVTATLRNSYERGGEELTRLTFSAREVESVAAVLGVPSTSDAINLRERATEKQVRESDLTRYRILHFAVHARAGDEFSWASQPTLVLSLADTDERYDGFLHVGSGNCVRFFPEILSGLVA